MQLKVVLPSGEAVNVPVAEKSTPGHLKENLKYSLRVPPKCIKLTCDDRVLDDIKPMSDEPNNVYDGATIIATTDGTPEDEVMDTSTKQAPAKSATQPTVIKKEKESSKPVKPKREGVKRPELKPDDVVKKSVIKTGSKSWAPNSEWMQAKSPKRHLALLHVLSVDDRSQYPEEGEGTMDIVLGDIHTSPVWTAAVTQMNIGERAAFTFSYAALDFDPEGLTPTDKTSVWEIELVRILETYDICEDFKQVLHVEDSGSAERAEDLDGVRIHKRVRRWTAEGNWCVESSRERIAILPGHGLVAIEDPNAPPVMVSLGEGQDAAVDIVAKHVGAGGCAHLYLKSDSLRSHQATGARIMDIEVVHLHLVRGPGTEGWLGWRSLICEREHGDRWLDDADGKRKQLETFDTMRKTTDDTVEAVQHVVSQVKHSAKNAERRYQRAVAWSSKELEADSSNMKMWQEKQQGVMGLAQAKMLTHWHHGEAAQADLSEEDKKALAEARALLEEVFKNAEEKGKESMAYDCMKLSLQVSIQSLNVAEGRATIEKMALIRPGDDDLKSEAARLNRLEGALTLKQGAGTVESMQKELRAANESTDFEACSRVLSSLEELMKANGVKYDIIKDLKVGKDVGNAMKLGNPDIAVQARKVVSEIQRLAQRGAIGL